MHQGVALKSGETRRGILIEDDPGYARLVERTWAKVLGTGCELVWADCLEKGLERLSARRFDVVLLDLTLPDSKGIETVERVTREYPNVPVVVLTGQMDGGVATEAIRRGAQDYLIKGENEKVLLGRAISYAIERKNAQEALRISERHFRAVIERNVDGVLIVDGGGKVLFVNPMAEDMLGRSNEELVGTDFGFPMAKEQTVEIELMTPKRGIRTAEMRTTNITWDGNPAILASLRDVTLRKEMEVSLQEKTRKLQETVEALEESKELIEAQNKKLSELSIRDGLTGLYDHYHMEKVIDREFSRAERYKNDLSCILIDLDHFKAVNDSYGHSFGDFVLKEFSKRLQKRIRESDRCFRYGGEEFLVLLPHTGLNGARQVAEGVRTLCEKEPYGRDDVSITITVSIGIASMGHHEPTRGAELPAFADKALYRAKAGGRNRCEVFLKDDKGGREAEPGKDRGVSFVREQVSAILEKTKQASIDSLEALFRQAGDFQCHEENKRRMACIELFSAKLGLPEPVLVTLKRAVKLHDYLQALIQNGVERKGEVLSEAERHEIHEQPYILAEMVSAFDFFASEREVLMYHHERYDGTGYPEGIGKDEIPMGARLFALAEAFVAMTSDRPYRKRLAAEKVVNELVENAGAQFDPRLVSLLLECIEERGLLDVPSNVLGHARERISELAAQ